VDAQLTRLAESPEPFMVLTDPRETFFERDWSSVTDERNKERYKLTAGIADNLAGQHLQTPKGA